MEKKQKNPYSTLMSNTLIFSIGSFSSKILIFFLLPLYTRTLTTAEYSTVDLVIQMANLLIPFITLSVAEAVIRFGLNSKYKSNYVFTTGLVITFLGILLFSCFMPFILQIEYVQGFEMLFYLYLVVAGVKLVFVEYVRAIKKVKLYAINGLITTVSMIALNLAFLLVFQFGVTGYLTAIILSDLISVVFLFFKAQLYAALSTKYYSANLARQMIKFSTPLIPAAVMWWVTNVSDRFFVEHFLGAEQNGLYTVAYKIPTIVTAVYAMFNQAWNMSAITEHDKAGKQRFYKNVFDSNSSFLYILAGGLILFIVPITNILVSADFSEAYLYSPILIVSTVFTCFSSFLGSIYAATKKTINSFVTSFVGAALNIALNFLLIPIMGINGASLATLICYLLVFILRMKDIQKFSKFKYLPGKIIINTFLLICMMLSVILLGSFAYIPLIICFVFIVLLNFPAMRKAARALLPERIVKKIPLIK